VVCVYGTAGWELMLGEVVCKSCEMVANSNNGLVSVTCCSGISKFLNFLSFKLLYNVDFNL
jgi:hypothetical protein